MTVAYHLRGYDKRTELLAVTFDIPVTLLPFVKTLLPGIAADPDLIEPHAIACDQVARLAQDIRITIDPAAFDFYIEADEDRRAISEPRPPIRARA